MDNALSRPEMLTTINALRCWSRQRHSEGKRIGFVPTMGALHEGHLSLVRAANRQCDATLVSIFVNPTQFGPDEDFHRYPRPLENDLKLLESVGAPAVFVPDVGEMYSKDFDTTVRVGGVTKSLEGRFRPAHFDGVATVVLKLFLAGKVDVAFFGQKDYQQTCVVRKMVGDLNVPVEIVVCPIVREVDGLAMSSRNRYLSDAQRAQAVVLSKSLDEAKRLLVAEKNRDVASVVRSISRMIRAVPETTIDYVAVVEPDTLRELTTLDPRETPEVVVLLAVKIGATRLIDNCILKPESDA